MSEKLTCDGGRPHCKPTMNYQEPVGPKGRHNVGPGLHGQNHGHYMGGPVGHETSGPTHHGSSKGPSGTQGRR